jgi:hypothetical protein
MSDQALEEPAGPVTEEKASSSLFGHTWEMELLISGGVVFTLMQLPPVLERGFQRLEPNVGGAAEIALIVGYLYGSGILYALIAAFLLHLAARAYWIGLLGLEAVYPHGVRWDNLPQMGPVTLRTVRDLLPSLRSMIVRVDAFCDVIFAFTFQVVFLFLYSIVLTLVSGVIAWLLSLLLRGDWVVEIILVLMFGYALTLSVLTWIDKTRGARLEPQGWTARAIRRMARLSYRSLFGSLFASVSYVLLSNRRRSLGLYWGIFIGIGVLAIAISQLRLQTSSLLLPGDLVATPDREIQPLFYEDQWPEEAISREPSIQSDVISDPYVKLFLPYMPRRHDPIFAERCPNPRTRLDCLPGLYQVKLDGRPIPGLTFHLATHPKSGARGFQAYIPTRGLPPGSHLLRIEPLPRPPNRLRAKLGIKPPQPSFIRFWT